MCVSGQPQTAPGTAADAAAMVRTGLSYLAGMDAGSLPAEAQADCLRTLEQAQSMHTAARAAILSAFAAQSGYEDDGQGSARTWLRWQTQITVGAAAEAMAWMRRLAAHPALRSALAAGDISVSFARSIAGWTDKLPDDVRADADAILLAAAASGAELADLAALAQEMRQRTARPDGDSDDDGFDDRWVRLDVTFRGAGRLEGDLSPQCTAALAAVLESLGKKAAPEDLRSKGQRDHDALEEACRRLIAAGNLPDVTGQPAQVLLHLTLDQLRSLNGAAEAEAAWAAGRAAADGEPGWLTSRKAAEAYACDAQIQPIVSGHVDPAALAAMTDSYLAGPSPAGQGRALSPRTLRRLQDTLLRYAADVLSGPAGLAAFLRSGVLAAEFPRAVSLPLDVGSATPTVPPHLRRAVIARDRHCAAPGCGQRPARCHVHHILPRSQGGATALANMILLCPFHHLIAVHRWGWTITLNGDGTTTFVSPDRKRALQSHGPPEAAAC